MKIKINIARLNSPLGEITAGATAKGLCLLEFDNQIRIEKHFQQFRKYMDFELVEKESEHIIAASMQLDEYFSGQRKSFDLPLDLAGTDFQIKVWQELLKIPFGTTRSYKEQSIATGDVKAIRAVATANGENRISIIIPCHRVIGSNGSLTGYGGGLWRKQKLLELETSQVKLF